jgi:D-glycero-D-manno-heptose 1,7-bisphosphate phosphatase
MRSRCVFLDRDGTINYDTHYLNDPDNARILKGVTSALRRLKKAGFLLIIISNQSGIARGYIKESALKKINSKITAMLLEKGIKIDRLYYCPHHKDGKIAKYRMECDCRKPGPGMILNARRDFDIDLENSFMVGDMEADIGAGKNAGLKGSVLVLTGHGMETFKKKKELKYKPDYIAKNLNEAASWILKKR